MPKPTLITYKPRTAPPVIRKSASANRLLLPHKPVPAQPRHFERSKPTLFLHVRSCERVGLRSEKSLFSSTHSQHTIRAVPRTFHVYFMASASGVLYLGVTSNLPQRTFQHKQKRIPGFTQKYNCAKLVWFEPHSTARAAIYREKEIKRWSRSKKIALIESLNPRWTDLSPTP